MNKGKIIDILYMYKALGVKHIVLNNRYYSHKKDVESNNVIKEDLSTQIKKESIPNKDKLQHKLNINHDDKFIANLKKQLQRIDCDLIESSINTVVGDGNINSKILIIGEAPGEQEDLKGLPFVGKSGILIRNALKSIGIINKNSFITNTVFWRPPGNRKPDIEEMKACYPYLVEIIQKMDPKLIILVGKTSAQHILGNTKTTMNALRGHFEDTDIKHKEFYNTYKIICLYHPAYLLRKPSTKKIMWEDLLKIREYLLQNKIL